jgi:hypothetical protein
MQFQASAEWKFHRPNLRHDVKPAHGTADRRRDDVILGPVVIERDLDIVSGPGHNATLR